MDEARHELSALHRALAAARDGVRQEWKDVIAADFDRRHWAQIDQAANDLLLECDRFEEMLSRAESALR